MINASLSTLAPEIDLDFFPPQHSHGMAIAMAHGKSPLIFVKIGIYIFNLQCFTFFEIGNVSFTKGSRFRIQSILSEYDEGGVCFLILVLYSRILLTNHPQKASDWILLVAA